MDQRQNPNLDPHAFRGDYNFQNNPQNDQFSNFLNGDNEPSFAPTWDASNFADSHDSINTFPQNDQTWQSSNFQNPQFPSPDYGISGRGYSEIYSRAPQSFDYTGFGSHAQQTLSTPAYDPRLGYQTTLGNQSHYTFSPSQNYQSVSNQSQTISPQALQHYPPAYSQSTIPKSDQPQTLSNNSQPAPRGISAAPGTLVAPLVDSQAWKSIAAKLPNGVARRSVLVRDAATLSASTNARKWKGSSFLSNTNVDIATTKATIPKQVKRRSKAEVRKLLLQEKGTGPWNLAREPVRKKLKVAAAASLGSRGSTNLRVTSSDESVSSAESSSESGSEDDSDYDSGSASEDESAAEEKFPLPPTRPDDPEKGTEYDIVKAVWAKRSVVLSGAVIKTALQEYGELIRDIRDQLKSESSNLDQATEKKDTAKETKYRNRVDGKRRLLESCARLTIKHGHKDIIERLGENQGVFAAFSQFLIDRSKVNEHTGSFVVSILELMSHWLKFDKELLEKTKLDKLLPRFVKRGDDVVQKFARAILEKSGRAANKAIPDGKPGQTPAPKDLSTSKASVENARASELATGIKRPRPSDTPNTSPTKKQASSTNGVGNAPKQVSLFEKKRQQAAKLDPKVSGKPATNTSATEKVKTNHITAKPSAFFSSLQSASKKSNLSKPGLAGGKSKDKSETGKGNESTSTKPAYSFAATMANLNKAKTDTPSKTEESGPPETPEEKTKRLRKEQRRKLRVSFKADDALVEVRTFEHDPEEELGHDDSMVRDVGDSRGEGQMLKMHQGLNLEDEDDDYEPAEQLPATWSTPSRVDFSVIEDGERKRNYTSRGGQVEVESSERGVQEQREMTKVLVPYISLSDVEPSPKEPSEPFSGEPAAEQLFGTPPKHVKDLESEYYSMQYPYQQQQAPAPMQAQHMPDVSALLKMINNQQQAPQSYQPQPAAQAPATGLEAIFARFSQNQQQMPQAPMQPATQQPPAYSLQAALAAMQIPPNQAQPAFAPTLQNQQPDIQSILAQISQQPQTQTQNYSYGNPYQSGNDRKRQAEADNQSAGNFGYGQGKRQKGFEKKYFGVPTQPCRYWQEGKCRKGSDCTFLHE